MYVLLSDYAEMTPGGSSSSGSSGSGTEEEGGGGTSFAVDAKLNMLNDGISSIIGTSSVPSRPGSTSEVLD